MRQTENRGKHFFQFIKNLNFDLVEIIRLNIEFFFAKRIKAQADLQFVKIFGD